MPKPEYDERMRRESASSAPEGGAAELIEGLHFYRQGDLMVFTAAYHLARGYCCGSDCLHCPYDHANVE